MPGSIGLLRVIGVPVRLHFTFILLVLFLLFLGAQGKQSGATTTIYVLALFGSVILHELGHAAVAKAYGVRTLEIVMFPIGGIARLERALKAPEELWVAIAGPAVNFVIAISLLAYLGFAGKVLPLSDLAHANNPNLLQRIAVGNLILALFNLLPAYPMDGGRILRSVLASFKPEQEATQIAARTGRVLAILMGLVGLIMMNFILVFVAFFVYLGAAQEGAAALGRTLLEGVLVRDAMVTDFRTLAHGDSIRDASGLLLATSQQDFPVMLGDSVLGLLGRNALLRALATEGPDSYVASAMDRAATRLSPDTKLLEALSLLSPSGRCALVMEGDHLLGLLTAENLTEYLLLRKFGMGPREARTQQGV